MLRDYLLNLSSLVPVVVVVLARARTESALDLTIFLIFLLTSARNLAAAGPCLTTLPATTLLLTRARPLIGPLSECWPLIGCWHSTSAQLTNTSSSAAAQMVLMATVTSQLDTRAPTVAVCHAVSRDSSGSVTRRR